MKNKWNVDLSFCLREDNGWMLDKNYGFVAVSLFLYV